MLAGVLVKTTPFKLSRLRIVTPPLEVISQPFFQLAETGVMVTALLRLIASLLARTSAAYNSKLAVLTCCDWMIDLKLGPVSVASTPMITRTVRSSMSVKPEDLRCRGFMELPLLGRCFCAVAVQRQCAIARLRGAGKRRGCDSKPGRSVHYGDRRRTVEFGHVGRGSYVQ